MKKFIIALILLLTIFLIVTRFAEVQQIFQTLQHGDLRFILLAAVVEFAWIYTLATTYQVIYRILGLKEQRQRLFLLATAAYFLSIVAPSGGVSGMAVFISDARKRGMSSARVTVASALWVLFDYGAFLCVLSLGLIVLIRRDNLEWTEIIASIILLAIALGLATLLYLGMKSAASLGNTLAYLSRIVNTIARPFIHRDYLQIERAYSFAHEIAEGITALKHKPLKDLVVPLLLSLLNKTLLITILILMFLAFKTPFTPGIIIASFSMGYLFLIVSPTPSGIGIVEGVLVISLSSLNIPLEAATVIALSYRGFTFWMPLAVGLFSFRRLTQTTNATNFQQ